MHTVIDLIEKQALKYPNKAAIQFKGSFITYAELLKNADLLANQLTRQGVGHESVVCILLDRSFEMFAAILGILKAGGAYLPIDPFQPVERIGNLLNDSKSSWVLSKPQFESRLANNSLTIINCDSASLLAYSEEPRCELNSPKPENLAYVIYTSGSTGMPKGVMIEHRALMTQLHAFQQLCPLVPEDYCLAVASYVFDVSVCEFFTSLTNGCTLHLLETMDVIDVVGFVEYNVQNHITSAYIPPSVVKHFSDYVCSRNVQLPFRRLIVGVEPIRQGVIEQIRKQMPRGCLLNGYGPTESTVWSTVLVFTQAYESNRITSIGKALPGYKVLIVDEFFNECPIGQKGQIIVGGEAVARGYLNNETLTAEKFRSGIVESDLAGRYYLTGDYAMYLEDGNIEFIGRIDNQIKIKGYRVELGEIEFAIESHSEIVRAVVIADKEEDKSYTLIAFYTTNTGQPIDEPASYLSSKLPGYMIPEQFVHLERIPTTITDKIDRRALLNLIPSKATVQLFGSSKGTKERLTSIYSEILKISDVNPSCSFFELGGDSIKAMILMLRIHQEFEKHLLVKDFYADSSLNAITNLIELETQFTETKPIDFKTLGNRLGVHFDLSASQHELYVLHAYYQSKLLHNIVFRIELNGKLNTSHLNMALQNIIHTHESFRTGFASIQGQPKQYVVPDIKLTIPFYDFSHKTLGFIQDFENGFGREQIDLAQPPLWRFVLVKRSEQTHYLYFLIHHLLFDGWSAGIFLAQLMQNYQHIEREGLIQTHNVKLGVIDFAVWQQDQLKSGAWDYELAYWEKKLKNLPKPYKLSGYDPTSLDYGKGNRVWWSIPSKHAEKLMELAKHESTSLYVVLLSCYFILLENLTGHKDHITTTPFANRTQPPFDQLIGYLTNMLAIRIRIDEGVTFQDLIHQVDKTCKEAYSHAMFPYGQLVTKLGYSITQGQSPLYQTMFVMQNWQVPSNEASSIGVKHIEVGNHTAKAQLTMNVDQKEDFSLDCWLEYPASVFSNQHIDYLINAFNLIVETLTENPKSKISQIHFETDLKRTKSAILVGEGAILQQCAESLSKRNWDIAGIISNDPALHNWALERKLDFTSAISNLKTILDDSQIDVLFSINNDWIIPSSTINSSKALFINYHNSLLPKYAGLYASNWSIFNKEQKHGVSWHLITDSIDAGHICQSMPCAIEPNESAFSLNLKCFDLAVQSFEKLLIDIEQNNLKPTEQELSQRSYFGRAMRPNRFCELLFDVDAQSIYSLCKSTEYGDAIYNDFGLPRLIIDNFLYLVPKITILPEHSKLSAGQICSVDDRGIAISTNTNIILITALLDAFGSTADLVNFAKKHSISSGYQFKPYGQFIDEKVFSQIFKNEVFWLNELLDFKPHYILPHNQQTVSNDGRLFKTHSTNFDKIIPLVKPHQKLWNQFHDTILAAVSLFLARWVDADELNLCVCFEKQSTCLTSSFVPVKLGFNPNSTVLNQLESVVNLIEGYKRKGSFFIDLFARHPELRKPEHGKHFLASSLAISCGYGLPDYSSFKALGLLIHIDLETTQVVFHSCFHQGPFSASYLVAHFENFLLQAFSADPLVKNLQMLLPDERTSVVKNTLSGIGSAHKATVIERMQQKLQLNHSQTAIEFGDQVYTYEDIDKQSDRIAFELLVRNVGPKAVVGIMMERSNWNIAAMIGVLKSGASYLPLDISYPISRISSIIDEAKMECILCFGPSSVAKDLPENLFLDIEQIDFSLEHVYKATLPKIELDTPAYVIYTSGSTGKPKGVQVSHNSLSAFVLGAVERYEVTSNDRILQFASPTFDAAVEEIYSALCAGASLVIRNETMVSSIEGFVAEVNAKQITVLDLPTAFWKQLVTGMLADRLSFHKALRLVIIGGEKADTETTQNWLDYFGKYPRLINTYGPTEATVVATTCYLDEIELTAEFPIGKQLGATTAWVTDRFYNLVPQGIEGQLLLGGPQVALGYLNDPELTSQRFIPDMFSGIHSNKLYVTGDRVVKDPNGNLLFKGRIDSQVKIRGFRIDLKEVNDAIRSLNPVKDCLTLIKQLNNAERLIAYVIPHNNTSIDEQSLRMSIKKVLPDYMLPSAFVFLSAFPLTRHMKLDYASLPLPKLNVGDGSEKTTMTSTQAALQELFGQVLKLPICSLTESFFNQGGDSLLALSIISKTNQLFGIQLTIGSLYQHPSILSFAALVDEQRMKLQTKQIQNETKHELVCLKTGSGLPPLVTIYFDAANKYIPSLVEEERPVYTIIPQGSDGEPIKLKTVESLANHYLDLINQKLPNQCIVLAGFSFGGLIALEMGIQMQSKANNIKRVIVVDTLAPHAWRKVFAQKKIVFNRVYLAGIAVKAVCRLAGKPIPLKYRNSVILRSWRKAAKRYKPDGKAEIILIKSSHSVSDEPLLGWQAYSEIKTRLRLIEGSHHSIIRDYKKVVTIVEWILNEQ